MSVAGDALLQDRANDASARSGYSRVIVPLLVLLTIAAFAGVGTCDFTNFDDPLYVTSNSFVKSGLTARSVQWALTHSVEHLYHPVTLLSLELDVTLFGEKPAGFHLENLLLHCIGVVMLFHLLRRLTDAPWRSALVTAVWAVHPLRVESVAWVTERKDMLMGLFGFWALHEYVSYVRRPRVSTYLWMLLLLLLSLLAKPAFIVVPAALLLLDYWPLNRFTSADAEGRSFAQRVKRLLIEKLPVVLLCTSILVVRMLGDAPASPRPPNRGGSLTWTTGLENALTSVVWYALSLFMPSHLAAFYPIPMNWPGWDLLASGAFLVAASVLALLSIRKYPWVFVGWCWFLLMLAPPVSAFKLQTYARADRYTYLPAIGLLIAVVWSLPNAMSGTRARRVAVAVVCGLLLITLATVTEINIRYWQDSDALWAQALAVTHENWMAENNYAMALVGDGKITQAIPHVAEAVRLNPGWAMARANYGNCFLIQGDRTRAIQEYETAIALAPPYPDAAVAAAKVLIEQHDNPRAIKLLEPAAPANPEARSILDRLLAEKPLPSTVPAR